MARNTSSDYQDIAAGSLLWSICRKEVIADCTDRNTAPTNKKNREETFTNDDWLRKKREGDKGERGDEG
jgi:hypothetical protein